jgi:hypothetical protein
MALFESYERRIDNINKVLNSYGIASIEEAEKTGCRFGRKRLYIVMIKFVAPILLLIVLLKSLGILTII